MHDEQDDEDFEIDVEVSLRLQRGGDRFPVAAGTWYGSGRGVCDNCGHPMLLRIERTEDDPSPFAPLKTCRRGLLTGPVKRRRDACCTNCRKPHGVKELPPWLVCILRAAGPSQAGAANGGLRAAFF